MATETADQVISPLVASLVEANARQAAWTTNTLIDGLQADLDTKQATLAAIRWQVADLLSGPYMPTPAAIEAALYPSKELVDKFREANR